MQVSLSVELPPDAERRVRAESPDLSTAVREGFLVNLFRRGVLTHFELSESLGLDRFATDGVLKRHQVVEHSPTHAEIDADAASIRAIGGVEDSSDDEHAAVVEAVKDALADMRAGDDGVPAGKFLVEMRRKYQSPE